MKRKTGYLLMLILIASIVISASGCENSSESSGSSDASGEEAYDAGDADDTEDETNDTTNEAEETAGEADDAEDAGLIEEDETDVDLLFYEDDNFAVRGTHLEIDEYGTITMAVEAENHSDEDWTISIVTAEINNLETNAKASIFPDAGETADGDLKLAYMGAFTSLSEITYIAVEFQAVNESYTDLFYEIAYAYIDGEENAVDYARESQSTDVVLIDTDNVRVTATDVTTNNDEYFPCIYINLYVENKGTADFISVDSGSEIVNGVSLDGATDAYLIEEYVSLGNVGYVRMEIDPDAAGISAPEEVETAEFTLTLNGVVYNDWNNSTEGDIAFTIQDAYSLTF